MPTLKKTVAAPRGARNADHLTTAERAHLRACCRRHGATIAGARAAARRLMRHADSEVSALARKTGGIVPAGLRAMMNAAGDAEVWAHARAR